MPYLASEQVCKSLSITNLTVSIRAELYQSGAVYRVQLNVYRETSWLLSFVYFLVGWHDSAANLPIHNVLLAQLAFPLNDIMFCLCEE